MKRVKAKKHLGQHFLTDESIAANIAGAISRHRGVSRVLEIGPGTGILTRALQSMHFDELKIIEIDSESIEFLNEYHPEISAGIIQGDFLKIELEPIFNGERFILAGNFPYNISSQILFRLFENRELIPELVGMFQREVAKRIASGPGSKEYGILSVLLQIYYDVEYLFTVDEDVFDPPPKVKSGVIKLIRNERAALPFGDNFMKMVVKAAFNQRRKTLRNSLKGILAGNDLALEEDILHLRPEQLSPETFITLAAAIHKTLNS